MLAFDQLVAEHTPLTLMWIACPSISAYQGLGTPSALFIFCGIEPRIQRERAQRSATIASSRLRPTGVTLTTIPALMTRP